MSGKRPIGVHGGRSGIYPIRPLPGRLTPAMRAKLERIVSRAPEVMVKITGRTKGVAHLKSHLAYITRNGELDAETEQGAAMTGRVRIEGPAATLGGRCRSRRQAPPRRIAFDQHHPVDAGGN